MNEPRERPILFSAPMVRAILEERKTQTRRVINPQPKHCVIRGTDGKLYDANCVDPGREMKEPWRVGDRLWVRETFIYRARKTIAAYRADFDRVEAAGVGAMYGGWKPSIFLPRRLSRINLVAVSVRAERVQDITEQDAIAEGIITTPCVKPINKPRFIHDPQGTPARLVGATAVKAYALLWEEINFKRGFGWKKNPWVWVIEFRRI